LFGGDLPAEVGLGLPKNRNICCGFVSFTADPDQLRTGSLRMSPLSRGV
jgi:hypothetical protein